MSAKKPAFEKGKKVWYFPLGKSWTRGGEIYKKKAKILDVRLNSLGDYVYMVKKPLLFPSWVYAEELEKIGDR